ncbi:chloride channel protein [Consotaella salsifontis]|uniref:Chloride channel protein, CIC family n=1 Tax=Consotaella salsifontis TaxID=1365950 RepID=A0A1T4QKX1_9HYPH|nr:chloride channel protein [Consotaella salsifontis]SKA04354.1 chloride channel protein, CIC family [Consotaella salsifontis]
MVEFRRRFRSSEVWFIVIALIVGALAGVGTSILQVTASAIQRFLYDLPAGGRLSTQTFIEPIYLLALPAGGLALILFTRVVGARRRPLVDSVEANALHGGRMSLIDSLIVAGQTLISNGVGASVGLEAAYAQMGSVVGSIAGQRLGLRRGDVRTLVGAGAGAAIAAAFGAPLTGCFYAFEIVIGAYMPSAIAPVAAAALAGTLVAHDLGAHPYIIGLVDPEPIIPSDYLLFGILGALLGFIAIGLMRTMSTLEALTRRMPASLWLRQVVGGFLMIPLALVTPQVLSSGHSALALDVSISGTLVFLGTIFIAKSMASIVCLAFGFRGGLFFASLFLGTIGGRLFSGILELVAGYPVVDPTQSALVGMAALAVAVIGGPLTMAMLVLEATRDLGITGVVIAATLVASTVVRVLFGYSFSTWRLHLRGETIRSARDVGWVRLLTAGRMMRKETRAVPGSITVAEFRRRFPLGSTQRVVLLDDAGHYAGIALTASAYDESADPAAEVASLAILKDVALTPEMNIVEVMQRFDEAESDEFAVIAPDATVLGLLSETHVRKRYAEELEKAQREMFGETQRQ